MRNLFVYLNMIAFERNVCHKNHVDWITENTQPETRGVALNCYYSDAAQRLVKHSVLNNDVNLTYIYVSVQIHYPVRWETFNSLTYKTLLCKVFSTSKQWRVIVIGKYNFKFPTLARFILDIFIF